MAHLFISYSRKDIDYVRRVVESLLERGFNVWFDAQIEYGENWESAIFTAIEDSAAVVVIMSPDAASSAWVPREIAYAENRGKPVFPLLLEGEVFPRLILTQFADVRSGGLPNPDYYAAIAKVTSPRSGRGEEIHIAVPSPQGFARRPPSTAVQERRLESAMPRQSARGVPTEVRVKISQLDTTGLRGELPDLTEYGDEIKKDDVRAATFPLTFPRAADGTLQPIAACIQVTADQYNVQYPNNPCGDGAAEVEIQPDHDTRTIIFTLVPKDMDFLGRAAVLVRLLVEGRVVAENLVATRISQEVTEHAFAISSASVSPSDAERAMSAPTRPVAVVDVSKTVSSSATTVPIMVEKRLRREEAPTPPTQSSSAPSPALSAPTQPMPRRAAEVPTPAQQPSRARKAGGIMRYSGLLGVFLAAIVGVLVLQLNNQRTTDSNPIAVTQLQLPTSFNTPSGTGVDGIRGIVGRVDGSGAPQETRIRAWTGDPVAGLTRTDELAPGTEVRVLSKAQIDDIWYLELAMRDGDPVWAQADDIMLRGNMVLEQIPNWEA